MSKNAFKREETKALLVNALMGSPSFGSNSQCILVDMDRDHQLFLGEQPVQRSVEQERKRSKLPLVQRMKSLTAILAIHLLAVPRLFSSSGLPSFQSETLRWMLGWKPGVSCHDS